MNLNNLQDLEALQMILQATNDDVYGALQHIIKEHAKNEVLDVINNMKRNHYLDQHPYEIYYAESEHRFRTYVPVTNGTKKRKPMVAKTKEELEQKVIDYYKQIEKDNVAPDTFEKLYPSFLRMKGKETSLENARKLSWAWDKYYRDSAIVKRKLKDISVAELKEFYLDLIQNFQLTSRQYKEAKSLINMIYDYAIERNIVQNNVSKNVGSISYKKYAIEPVKSREEQVYVGDEQPAIIDLAIAQYEKTRNMAYLGVCLNFFLALRVGELVSLKVEDFDFSEGCVHIKRQEIGNVVELPNTKLQRDGYKVSSFAKTPHSIRDEVLTKNAKEFFNKIVSINESNGYSSEYLLLNQRGERMHKDAINNALRRLNKKLGTPQKSNHSIRKTCLSNMHNSMVLSDEEIRAFAGHKHISTTQNCYFHDTQDHGDTRENYQKAIDGKMHDISQSIQSI